MKKASKLATSPISYFLARCANNDLADIDSNAKKRKKKKDSTEILLRISYSYRYFFPIRVHFLSFIFFLNGIYNFCKLV